MLDKYKSDLKTDRNLVQVLNYGKFSVFLHPCKFIFWKEGAVPQPMRDKTARYAKNTIAT